MKKLFSMFLVLMMVLGLFAAVGGSALADGDVTILFTADIGTPAEGGITYDAVAALKQSCGSALLVDAGGYSADSVSAMNAAGYDLAAAVSGVSGADFSVISLADSSYNGGAALTCGGSTVAFVSLAVPSGSDTASYYESVQSIVDQALSNGVSYVVGIGTGIDAYGVAANVTGIDAILTSGSSNGSGSVSLAADTAEEEENAEEEEAAEVEETAVEEAEEPVQDGTSSETLVAVVGSDFAGVGVLTLSADGASYYCKDADSLREAGLLADDGETAEEASEETAAEEDAEEPAEEETEEDAAAEDETAEDEILPAAEEITDGEDDTAEAEEPQTDGAEEPADENAADPVAEAASGSDLEESPVSGSDAETPDNNGTDENTAGNTDNDDTTEGDTEDDAKDDDEIVTLPEVTEDKTTNTSGETSSKTEAETPDDTTVTFTKGTTDLVLTADKAISSVNFTYTGLVNNVAQQITSTLGLQYYSVNDKQVTIHASCLNSWGNGSYTFNLKHADGTTTDVKVKITGTAPANTSTASTTTTTTTTTGSAASTTVNSTTANTATTVTGTGTAATDSNATTTVNAATTNSTSATPAAATIAPTGTTSTSGGILSNNPLTGDTTQILPWVIGLVVLAAAMVVVVVILSKRQKRR